MSEKFKGKYRIPSARLSGYDYGRNGAYFITLCTKNRKNFFGEIKSTLGAEKALLCTTTIGGIAEKYWTSIPEHFSFVDLDEFQIMPNHIHGIVIIDKPPLTSNDDLFFPYKNRFGPQSGNLSSIIRAYKAGVKSYATINEIQFDWQPRFYDHIIRNKKDMNRIRKYIIDNPVNWIKDKNNDEGIFM